MLKSYAFVLSVVTIGAASAQTTPSQQPTSPPAPSVASTTMSDQTFVQKASAAGLGEVRDAQKALQTAQRDDVRRAAQQLLRHSRTKRRTTTTK